MQLPGLRSCVSSFIVYFGLENSEEPQARVHHRPFPTRVLTVPATPVLDLFHYLACFLVGELMQKGVSNKQVQPVVKPCCQRSDSRIQGHMNWFKTSCYEKLLHYKRIRLGLGNNIK